MREPYGKESLIKKQARAILSAERFSKQEERLLEIRLKKEQEIAHYSTLEHQKSKQTAQNAKEQLNTKIAEVKKLTERFDSVQERKKQTERENLANLRAR